MNKKVSGMAVALMVIAMLALPISAVSATAPMQITGKWQFTGFLEPPYNYMKAGANIFVTWHNTGMYFEGPILGTHSQTMDWIIHYGDPAIVESLPETPAPVWFTTPHDHHRIIERVFEGTVNGISGTLLMHLEIKQPVPATPGSGKGTWVIISGTGGLSNLQGQGTWTNFALDILEYEGQIHFDP